MNNLTPDRALNAPARAAASPDPSPRLSSRLFLLTLATFASTSASFVFAGQLEPMAADLGVSTPMAGQLQTLYVLVASLLGPPLVHALRRQDRRNLVLLGLSLGAISNLACAMAPDFPGLLLWRAPAGLAAALTSAAAAVAASAMAPESLRGRAVATVSAGLTLAFMAGIPLGSLVGAAFGWRATFVFGAALSWLAFVGVLGGLPRTPPPPEAARRAVVGATWPLYATSLLTLAPAVMLSLYIAPIVRVGADVTGAGVGIFQALIGVGSLAGLVLGGRAADRGAGRAWILGAFAVLAAAMALHVAATAGVTPTGWASRLLVGTATLVTAAALFSVMPIVQARLLDLTGGAPLALALNASAMGLGQAIGAVIGGLALAQAGVPAVPGAALALALLSLVLIAIVYRGPRARSAGDIAAARLAEIQTPGLQLSRASREPTHGGDQDGGAA